MANKIGWCDQTWNPITGCSPVSAGCQNCYAKKMACRQKGRNGYDADNPFKITFHENRMEQPSKWRNPRKIFVCSMGDLFHEDVPLEHIFAVWSVMLEHERHTFMILTKRPARMADVIKQYPECSLAENIWVGVTAENQQTLDRRVRILTHIPATVRFVSIEPQLENVEIINGQSNRWAMPTVYDHAGNGIEWTDPGEHYMPVDWVICGPESGTGKRTWNPKWGLDLQQQCKSAGVPFYFKQNNWPSWNIPFGLLVTQEFPEVA